MLTCVIVMTLYFTPIGKAPESGFENLIQGTNTIEIDYGSDIDACYYNAHSIVESYRKSVKARIVAHIELRM